MNIVFHELRIEYASARRVAFECFQKCQEVKEIDLIDSILRIQVEESEEERRVKEIQEFNYKKSLIAFLLRKLSSDSQTLEISDEIEKCEDDEKLISQLNQFELQFPQIFNSINKFFSEISLAIGIKDLNIQELQSYHYLLNKLKNISKESQTNLESSILELARLESEYEFKKNNEKAALEDLSLQLKDLELTSLKSQINSKINSQLNTFPTAETLTESMQNLKSLQRAEQTEIDDIINRQKVKDDPVLASLRSEILSLDQEISRLSQHLSLLQ